MLPNVRTHQEYLNFVDQLLELHYTGSVFVLQPEDRKLLETIRLLDLSGTFDIIRDSYSRRGPLPHDPADMLRSILLMVLTGTPSIDKWVTRMRQIPFLTILGGFLPGKSPGIGTFYDFFTRLWLSDKSNFNNPLKRKGKKVKKPDKKGDKAPTTSVRKTELVVKGLDRSPNRQKDFPFDRIFQLFKELFVLRSADIGILGDVHDLCLAGDGTPVKTSAYPRSKRICDCKQKGITNCDCRRRYSQPDCNSGWDSYRQAYFNGYHAYFMTAASSKYDLPVYVRLHPASRHDAISMLLTTEEMRFRYPEWTWTRVLLDSAHDAMPIYHFFKKRGVVALIDLNRRSSGNTPYIPDFQLSPDGIPICQKGLEMKNNGYDHTRRRRKYRCPLIAKGIVTCDSPCSKSSYGRCIYTYTDGNPRLFPPIARNSDEWKNAYKRRTTVERCNKREKIDYALEAARHRNTKMWTIRTYAIMMCMHLDAWFRESVQKRSDSPLTA